MRIKRIAAVLLAVLICIPSVSPAVSIQEAMTGLVEEAENWHAETGVQFEELVPYGKERLEHLNALLKHLTLLAEHSGDVSAVGLKTDGTEFLRMTVKEEDRTKKIRFSFDPGRTWVTDSVNLFGESILPELPGWEALSPDALLTQLNRHHIRLIEDAFTLTRSLPSLFSDYAKTTAIKTKIKNAGTAVQKIVITVGKSAVEEGILGRLTDSGENPVLNALLNSVTFSGRQQFTLYLDADGNLIRFRYSGQVIRNARPEENADRDPAAEAQQTEGNSSAELPAQDDEISVTVVQDAEQNQSAGKARKDLRNVSLDWKRLQETNRVRDEFTLKCPAVNGTNKDTLTFTRNETYGDENSAELEASHVRVLNRKKSTLDGAIRLTAEGDHISGTIECTFGNGKATPVTLTISPDIRYRQPTEWQGNVRFVSLNGKATQTDALLQITAGTGASAAFTEAGEEVRLADADADQQATLLSELQRMLAAAMIRPLLSIPEEDLLFISDELAADAWKSTVQTANPSSEGGTHP